jgi:hypothetical protein
MMGMVFTELLEMVEQKFSFDTVDAILQRSGAHGSYTAVGDYDDAELHALVAALAEETGVPAPDLLHAYGVHLFGRFHDLFPDYFRPHTDAPSLFGVLESHVHTEVRKLYHTAHPPLLVWEPLADGGGWLEYRSPRGLGHFAQGLLEASLAHFGSVHRLEGVEDLSAGASTHVRFRVARA